MDSARPSNSPKLLTLKQAARRLGVSDGVLLAWNEQNILKPTIGTNGKIGYTQEQIDHYLKLKDKFSRPLTKLQSKLSLAHLKSLLGELTCHRGRSPLLRWNPFLALYHV